MIKNFFFLLGVFLLVASTVRAADPTDNVIIKSIETTYKLKANKQGRLVSVKVYDREVYQAKDYDEVAMAYTSYGDHITIDKASAPGAKPVYEPMISSGIFYEDHRVCLLKVNAKRDKPVTVEFERTLKDPAQFCEMGFSSIYDVDVYTVNIEVPAALAESLVLTPVNFPADASVDKLVSSDGSLKYTYIIRNKARLRDEPMSPSSTLTQPFVRVSGYFDSVDALYAYLKSYVTEEAPSADINALVAELTATCSSDTDKINAIASWVRQNIRYVAIEHGEYGQRPELAANVLKNRYGDCKGSANLIKVMLKAAGLDGRLVWIGTRDQIDTTWDQVPMLSTGNHMIAACMIDGVPVYLDGTTDYSPAGYLSSQLRGQSALIEDGDRCIVATVPQSAELTDIDHFQASYTLNDDLSLSGSLTHTYSGLFARRYDGLYNSITASERDKLLHLIASNDKKSISVNEVKFCREHPDSQYAYLHASVTDDKAVKRTADRSLLSFQIADPDYAQTFDLEKRKNPICINYPCRYTAEIDINLGERTRDIEMPADVDLDTPWFTANVRYSLASDTLHVTADVQTAQLYADQGRVAEWNTAVRNLKKALNPVIKIKNKTM